MNIEAQRAGYRERLKVGDTVYFASDESRYGAKLDIIGVMKATVVQTHYDGIRKRYPVVALWDGFDEKPVGCYVATGISPREAFTEEEVIRVLRHEEGPISSDERSISEMLEDPNTNYEIAVALAAKAMYRIGEDGLMRPRDPEYA